MTASPNKWLQVLGSTRPLLVCSTIFAGVVFVLFLLSILGRHTGMSALGIFYFFYLFSGFVLTALGCLMAIAFVALPPYSKTSLCRGIAAFTANGALIALQIHFFMPH
jgi:hypothetical protein